MSILHSVIFVLLKLGLPDLKVLRWNCGNVLNSGIRSLTTLTNMWKTSNISDQKASPSIWNALWYRSNIVEERLDHGIGRVKELSSVDHPFAMMSKTVEPHGFPTADDGLKVVLDTVGPSAGVADGLTLDLARGENRVQATIFVHIPLTRLHVRSDGSSFADSIIDGRGRQASARTFLHALLDGPSVSFAVAN